MGFMLDTTWKGTAYATAASAAMSHGAKGFKHAGVAFYCGGDAEWSRKMNTATGQPVLITPDAKVVEHGDVSGYNPACWRHWSQTPGVDEMRRRGLLLRIDQETYWGEQP